MTHQVLIIIGLSFFLSLSLVFIIGSPIFIEISTSSLSDMILGQSFPPLANTVFQFFMVFCMKHLNISHLRFAEDWALREPVQGQYIWTPMKNRLDFMRSHGYSVFLTFQSNGPDWAIDKHNDFSATFKNVTQFETFLHSWFSTFLLYKDVIKKVQFGNEWVSNYWFVGSASEFSLYANVFYNISKQYWPDIPVVLGGFSTGSLRALAALYNVSSKYQTDEGIVYEGASLDSLRSSVEAKDAIYRTETVVSNTSYDYIDLHLYDDCDNFGLYWQMMINLTIRLGKGTFPFVCTEFGGPNMNWEPFINRISGNYHAKHLQRCLQSLGKLNLSEIYYFQIVTSASSSVEHRQSQLFNDLLMMKPSFYVLQNAKNGKITYVYEYIILYSVIITSLISVLIITIIKCFKKDEKIEPTPNDELRDLSVLSN